MKVVACTALLLLVSYATTSQLAESRNDGLSKDSSNANRLFVEQQDSSQPQEAYGRLKRSERISYYEIPLTDEKLVGKKDGILRNAKHVYNYRLPAQQGGPPVILQPVNDENLIQYAKNLKPQVGPTDTITIWHNPTVYGPPTAYGFYVIEGMSSDVVSDPPTFIGKKFVYNIVRDEKFRSALIRFKPIREAHLEVSSIQDDSRVFG